MLEIDGSDALVQLFESSTGINLSNSKVRFLGRSMELGVSEDMLGQMCIRDSKDTVYLAVVCLTQDAEKLEEVLRSRGLSLIHI